MDILTKLKIKRKEKKYIKYIEEHRENMQRAFCELVLCDALDWIGFTEDFCVKLKSRADNHDLSKYENEEFNAYRKYYHPIDIGEKIEGKLAFDEAWEHHWKNNRHHWQARQNDPEEMTEEIKLDCLENIMDWLAMGYKFNDRPYEFYNKKKKEIILPKVQIDFMEKVISDLEKGSKIDKGIRI